MRLLNWNIRHGGGRRIPRIVAAIDHLVCDVAVLTEFRQDDNGTQLCHSLRDIGFGHVFAPTSPHEKSNGVLIASKIPIEDPHTIASDLYKPNALARAKVSGISVVAAYLPNGKLKTPYWERLLKVALGGGPLLITGDFNKGKHYLDENGATLVSAAYMDRIEEAGLVDAFRSRNPGARVSTWYSNHGNGFRLDHAFASPDVDRRLSKVEYLHDVRENGASDHSAMLVEIDL